MAPKYHPTPLSGGDRKALSKELAKARAMTGILAERSQEKRRAGEALIREADTVADIRARMQARQDMYDSSRKAQKVVGSRR
jgi:hypothetical protein